MGVSIAGRNGSRARIKWPNARIEAGDAQGNDSKLRVGA